MLSVSYTSSLIAAMCERVWIMALPPGKLTEAVSSKFGSQVQQIHPWESGHWFWAGGTVRGPCDQVQRRDLDSRWLVVGTCGKWQGLQTCFSWPGSTAFHVSAGM